ncbi:unnamed protein product [Schistocephalus solidus]|uniref:Uncharacterized protein n=1 Tax=Schistocephalus solidus TaxID=70667 RepID=A0A183TU91_SCHSO|nr:unnamed protein product [Schistocephalus solidus]
MATNTTGTSNYHFASWHTAERSTPPLDSHPIIYGQAVTSASQSTSATLYSPQTQPHPKHSLRNSVKSYAPHTTPHA